MSKTADTEQHNCYVGGPRQPDAAGRDHEHGTEANTGNSRMHQMQAEFAYEPGREIASENATEVGCQEWEPGEHCNLRKIHPAPVQIQGNPETKGLPRRFDEKTRGCNRPEPRAGEDIPSACTCGRNRGALGGDIRPFLFCDRG